MVSFMSSFAIRQEVPNHYNVEFLGGISHFISCILLQRRGNGDIDVLHLMTKEEKFSDLLYLQSIWLLFGTVGGGGVRWQLKKSVQGRMIQGMSFLESELFLSQIRFSFAKYPIYLLSNLHLPMTGNWFPLHPNYLGY